MLEIVIIGRGGQGAQVAGNQLAQAFFAEGKYVQSFATYGGARRGGPVSSSIRVDDEPVQLRCNIERADALLCFDGSLLDATWLRLADRNTRIVVNSARTAEEFAALGDFQVVPIDGRALALEFGLGKVVNSALLGALAAILGAPRLDTLCAVIEETAPALKAQNVAACRHAHALACALPAQALAPAAL